MLILLSVCGFQSLCARKIILVLLLLMEMENCPYSNRKQCLMPGSFNVGCSAG